MTALSVALVLLGEGSGLHAADISFTLQGFVNSPTDVTNLGRVIEAQYAFGAGAGNETVNGVTFTEGFTDYATSGGTFAGTLNGRTTGNTAYDTILNGSSFPASGSNPSTLTLTGLTLGTTYQVQLFSLDDRTGTPNPQSVVLFYADPAGHRSNGFQEGSNSIFVGTFVADGPTEAVTVMGFSFAHQLNAFAVTTAVPEPGSWAMVAGGLGLLIGLRRFRQKAARGAAIRPLCLVEREFCSR